MTTAEFFNKLLPYYRGYYDMEQPYDLRGMECLAHGHFYSHSEKYVLSKEARLWESDNFEHVFFMERDVLREKDLEEMDRVVREYVEPEIVRKGKKYPERNHMYTYLTFVYLCSAPLEKEIIKSVKNYHFTRNYLFSIRGFCEVKLVAADLSGGVLYTNGSGASLKKLYKKLLKEKDGFRI